MMASPPARGPPFTDIPNLVGSTVLHSETFTLWETSFSQFLIRLVTSSAREAAGWALCLSAIINFRVLAKNNKNSSLKLITSWDLGILFSLRHRSPYLSRTDC